MKSKEKANIPLMIRPAHQRWFHDHADLRDDGAYENWQDAARRILDWLIDADNDAPPPEFFREPG